MANLQVNTQLLDQEDFDSNSDNQTPEEVMSPPRPEDLPNCEPKITIKSYYHALAKDRVILTDLLKASDERLIQLYKPIQSQAQTILEEAQLCTDEAGAEDFWSHFIVWQMLRLARGLSGRESTVQAIPLTTATISPCSLLTTWNKTTVSKRVGYGLVIKLSDDIAQQVSNIPDPESNHEYNGIGPAATVKMLRTHPLFCHVEVKKEFQIVDPVVQLGVWTSAVYKRWEQVQTLSSKFQDLPVSFAWTVTGHRWLLHVIRRLPDGSRRITQNHRAYNTDYLPDIYLIIATLHYLMEYGDTKFRKQFCGSVLNIQAD